MASISLRQSIAWLPAPHSEPTSTVVLTSPQRRFVDVRITLPPGSHPPSMVDGSFQIPAGASHLQHGLDWALAGTSSSTPVAGTNGAVSDGVWRHWVDSRYEDADAQVDAGRNTEQADGSVLETGSMENPATGQVAPYEEVWRDIAPVSALPWRKNAPVSLLPEEDRRPRCIVLQLHDPETNDRGVAMLLGQFCQGIARTEKDGVTVERWQWRPAGPLSNGEGGHGDRSDSPESAWHLLFRHGSGSLPCFEALSHPERLTEGKTVTGLDRTGMWTVVEATNV